MALISFVVSSARARLRARTLSWVMATALLGYTVSAVAQLNAEPSKPVTNLRDVHKIYIEKMPNDFDSYLRAAISKKLGSYFTIVLDRSDADAILESSNPRSADTVGTVTMVDPSHKIVLWSGSADDRDRVYLNLRHGGERKVADKLAGQLKHAVE